MDVHIPDAGKRRGVLAGLPLQAVLATLAAVAVNLLGVSAQCADAVRAAILAL
jgi:hypothetical protein